MNVLETMIPTTKQPSISVVVRELVENIQQGIIDKPTIWNATTIPSEAGGFKGKFRRIVFRALREAGFCFYFAVYKHPNITNRRIIECGITEKKKIRVARKDPDLIKMHTGPTPNVIAHKLGDGNATKGWQMFNQQN